MADEVVASIINIKGGLVSFVGPNDGHLYKFLLIKLDTANWA